MTCREIEGFLEAYADGEFEGPEQAEIESHLAGCDDCRDGVEAHKAFKRCLRGAASGCSGSNHSAPDRLRASIAGALDQQVKQRQRARLKPVLAWGVLTAAAAAGTVLWIRAGLVRERASSYVSAAIANHQRALPLDVQDEQLAKIQSFFQGKVDFPPSRILNLRNAGLVGGRISSLSNHQAAYVVWQKGGQRRISLFVFDAPELTVPRNRRVKDRDLLIANQHGYNAVLWKDQGIAYSLVSDLDEQDIIDLVAASSH
jgi:anti-sigma factor RsiW